MKNKIKPNHIQYIRSTTSDDEPDTHRCTCIVFNVVLLDYISYDRRGVGCGRHVVSWMKEDLCG